MQYTINQLYDHLYQKVYDIYDIFKNFFNEENVDLQTSISQYSLKTRTKSFLLYKGIPLEDDKDTKYEISDTIMSGLEEYIGGLRTIIYVWWKDVTVTNEYDKSIDIQDLYAKIDVQLNGNIPYESVGFYLNRATYTKEQFLSNYMHSHIQNIPKDDFTFFMPPCLGNGPIKDTINTLKTTNDDAEWMLFCQELSMYVTVESIAGVPWKRLEEVGEYSLSSYAQCYNDSLDKDIFIRIFGQDTLKTFIKYYLKNGHLTISYENGQYVPGMPYFDYIIDLSNAFIDFYNEFPSRNEAIKSLCFSTGLIGKVIVSNGKFYLIECVTSSNIDRYRNKFVLKFKGKDIYTTITESKNSEATETIIIKHSFAMYVLKSILKVINYRYINEYNHEYRTEKSSSSCERVLYL